MADPAGTLARVSPRHELEHLYPQLSEGGVLIVDDYGHYEGARWAVDDYTGRVAVKQGARVPVR